MICRFCNAEIPDSELICPYCEQSTADAIKAEPSEKTAAVDSIDGTAAMPTQVLPQQEQPQTTQPYGAYGQPQPQTSQPYGTYGQQQAAQPYGAYGQPQSRAASGAPEPPLSRSSYGGYAQQQGQPAYGAPGQPQQGAGQIQGYPAAAAVPAKKSKKPLIIVAVVIAAIVVVLGVSAAMGAGPFAGGGNAPGGVKLNPNDDPIAQLDATVKDIQDSGKFGGEFSLDMTIDMGELGKEAGLEDGINVTMDGSYSVEDYDPNDLSKFKMKMEGNMEAMGEETSYAIDFADGQATMTANGQTETLPYTAEDMKKILEQSGGLTYDSSTMGEYIKSSRIEGDTIIIELDSDFLNKTIASSLSNEGLSGMDASFDTLELKAKIGDGQVTETIDMDFEMSYMGQKFAADLSMNSTMAKM